MLIVVSTNRLSFVRERVVCLRSYKESTLVYIYIRMYVYMLSDDNRFNMYIVFCAVVHYFSLYNTHTPTHYNHKQYITIIIHIYIYNQLNILNRKNHTTS